VEGQENHNIGELTNQPGGRAMRGKKKKEIFDSTRAWVLERSGRGRNCPEVQKRNETAYSKKTLKKVRGVQGKRGPRRFPHGPKGERNHKSMEGKAGGGGLKTRGALRNSALV